MGLDGRPKGVVGPALRTATAGERAVSGPEKRGSSPSYSWPSDLRPSSPGSGLGPGVRTPTLLLRTPGTARPVSSLVSLPRFVT